MRAPIHLIDLHGIVTDDQLAPFRGDIVVCDCQVEGVESWEAVVGGFRKGRVLNVDHHADHERMRRRVSSANLALEYVAASGTPASDLTVIVNHSDCDSILSSGIMSGRLQPDPEFGVAAIAADHTGAEHPIADLLQALDRERDLDLSFASLAALLGGRPHGATARRALADRQRMRAAAEDVVVTGRMHADGPIAWGVFEETIQGEFFPALLPEAVVILAIAPHHDLPPGRMEMKLRLGAKAPPGFTLKGLLDDFDPGFGGRWNAGANRRPRAGSPGGSDIAPTVYAAELRRRVERMVAAMGMSAC
ncbi:MAG: hypothetical protein ACYC2G_04700 [Gemmatimonadaceae bacterium]